MKTKHRILGAGILLTVILSGCIVQREAAQPDDAAAQQSSVSIWESRAKLKGFAFCSCVKHFQPDYAAEWNEGSAGGFFETGNHGLSAYDTIDSATTHYLAHHRFRSAVGKNLVYMACLQYYNSRFLDSVVTGLDSLLSPSPPE